LNQVPVLLVPALPVLVLYVLVPSLVAMTATKAPTPAATTTRTTPSNRDR
jgi:hypothetical protein